jgi:hypothetical protein
MFSHITFCCSCHWPQKCIWNYSTCRWLVTQRRKKLVCMHLYCGELWSQQRRRLLENGSENTPVTRQWLVECNVTAATHMYATLEGMLVLMISVLPAAAAEPARRDAVRVSQAWGTEESPCLEALGNVKSSCESAASQRWPCEGVVQHGGWGT